MELGALNSNKPVIVVAVCERARDLPPSLRATGRFGSELPLRLPRAQDRKEMLSMFLNIGGVNYKGDYQAIISETKGLSGGDIKEICRRAILSGARNWSDTEGQELELNQDDALRAIDRWKLTRNPQDE
jgi:SpoVK/Ycf46/Vps4 family AAA+-type ATPase